MLLCFGVVEDVWLCKARTPPKKYDIDTALSPYCILPYVVSFFKVLFTPSTSHPCSASDCPEEVGSHALLIVGGDLFGPSYVTFDPYNGNGKAGEVSIWPGQAIEAALPLPGKRMVSVGRGRLQGVLRMMMLAC